jgi:hypothetical protein
MLTFVRARMVNILEFRMHFIAVVAFVFASKTSSSSIAVIFRVVKHDERLSLDGKPVVTFSEKALLHTRFAQKFSKTSKISSAQDHRTLMLPCFAL